MARYDPVPLVLGDRVSRVVGDLLRRDQQRTITGTVCKVDTFWPSGTGSATARYAVRWDGAHASAALTYGYMRCGLTKIAPMPPAPASEKILAMRLP